MLKFLMSVLGKDPSVIPDGADIQFVWSHPPVSWQVFLVLAVLAGLWSVIGWFYRREATTCPRGMRILLAVLRSLVIFIAVLIFLGPAVGVSVRQTVEPSVLVLLDESLSMSVRDRYRDPESLSAVTAFTQRTETDIRRNPTSRIALVNELLTRNDGEFLRQLAAKGRVQVLSFAENTKLRETVGVETSEPVGPRAGGIESGGSVPPVEACGTGTHIGRALREAVQSAAGNRVAAIVLVSDGCDTVAEDPQEMAARFGGQGIPVFTVPVGDPTAVCNVRITELWAPESVPQQDPFSLQAHIQVRNVDADQLTVELRQSPADAPETDLGTVVASASLTIERGQTTYSVDFSHQPERAGRFRYTAAVPVLPDEIMDTDNRRSTRVRVLDQKLRLLLISAGPSWDYRLVRTLLLRDATVDLSCWLQSLDATLRQEGNTPIDHLPATPAELFVYDGVLMMDPNPEAFTEQWLELLRDFVGTQGGGLLWMAGATYTAQALTWAQGGVLRELLPVRGQDAAALAAAAGQPHTGTREWSLRIRGAGADHPMLRLASDPDRSVALWGNLPGVYWYYPVKGAAPGAQVLIEHADPGLKNGEDGIPLLVEGRFGAGRVIWMGYGETWRWRRAGEEPFNRFWIQASRELASGRTLRGQSHGHISTDRDGYTLGDTVRVTARVFDAIYRPLVAPLVKARVAPAGTVTGQDIELAAVAGREGVYSGSFTARHLGPTEIQLAATETGDAAERPTCSFTVELPNIEFAEPQLNRGLLQVLATTSGGACLNLDQVADLPRRIPDRRESLVTRSKPIELWDTWRVLLLLGILLGIEWALRKRYHLM